MEISNQRLTTGFSGLVTPSTSGIVKITNQFFFLGIYANYWISSLDE
jgi:hypothetical protein